MRVQAEGVGGGGPAKSRLNDLHVGSASRMSGSLSTEEGDGSAPILYISFIMFKSDSL